MYMYMYTCSYMYMYVQCIYTFVKYFLSHCEKLFVKFSVHMSQFHTQTKQHLNLQFYMCTCTHHTFVNVFKNEAICQTSAFQPTRTL